MENVKNENDLTKNHEVFVEDEKILRSSVEKYTKTFDEMLTGEIGNFPLRMNKSELSADVAEEINVDEIKESEQIENKVSGEEVEIVQKEEIYEEKTKAQDEVKTEIYEDGKKDNEFVEETLEHSDYEVIDLEKFEENILQEFLAKYGDTKTLREDATKLVKGLIFAIEDIFQREYFNGTIEVELLKKIRKDNLESVKDEAKKLVEKVILAPQMKENIEVQVEENLEYEYEKIKTQTDDLEKGLKEEKNIDLEKPEGKFQEKLPIDTLEHF